MYYIHSKLGALCPQNKTLTWDTGNSTTLPDLTDCMKQAVRPVPALLLTFAYLIGCRALLRSQRPAHLDDVGFSWLLFVRVRSTPNFYMYYVYSYMFSSILAFDWRSWWRCCSARRALGSSCTTSWIATRSRTRPLFRLSRPPSRSSPPCVLSLR